MNIKTQFGTSYIIFKSLVIAGAVFLTLVFSSTLSSYVNRADAEENSSAIEKVQDIAWNEHRTLLFVLNKNDTVSVYDAKADQFIVSQKPLNVLSMRVIEISQDGAFVAISAYPDGRDMLVSIFKLGDIINENTPTPTEEYAIASASTGFTSQQFSKDGRFFFTTRGVGAIYVLKTEEKDLRKITLGENDIPRDITEMNGGRIAVINEGSNDMVIVDFNAGKVLKRIKVGTMPRKVLYNAVTGRLFVSHLGSGDVYVIDGKTLARVAVLK
ncbi:MAG: hypothetical protein Q7S52_00385, partial [bacterium]|nr:hypothetical protein [bacterium]